MSEVVPGAEPLSIQGGDVGVLVVHGFTGSPSSMRSLAVAAGESGNSVELVRLPGHGTTVEEMNTTTWDDWTGSAEAAYEELSARSSRTVVIGLSMGGSIAAWLATRHREISGIMCINALVLELGEGLVGDDDVVAQATEAIAAGIELAPAIGSDIAKEGIVELAYDAAPLRALLSLGLGIAEMSAHLSTIACPILIANSPQDHVVEPSNSDHLAKVASGPVRRITLERSYHVATLDHDEQLLIDEMLSFIAEVT